MQHQDISKKTDNRFEQIRLMENLLTNQE